jgi:hypothetical protein
MAGRRLLDLQCPLHMFLHGSATLRAGPELNAFDWLRFLVRHIELEFLVGDMPALGALNVHLDYDRNPGIQARAHAVSSTLPWPLSYGLVDAPAARALEPGD